MKLCSITIVNQTYEVMSCNIGKQNYILNDIEDKVSIAFHNESFFKRLFEKKVKINFVNGIYMKIPTKCRIKKNEEFLFYHDALMNYKFTIYHIREDAKSYSIIIKIKLYRISNSYLLRHLDARNILNNIIHVTIEDDILENYSSMRTSRSSSSNAIISKQ